MKKERPFTVFSKKHKILYVSASIILILPLAILLAVFTNWFKDFSGINDFSAWGSIVAGIVTYIGAALLGIVSYYGAWLNQYRAERLDYSIETSPFYNGKLNNFFDLNDFPNADKKYCYEIFEKDNESFEEKSYSFKRIVVNNFNSNYPMHIEILKVELSIDDSSYSDCTNDVGVVTNFDFRRSIEYKNDDVLLLGINDELLKYRKDSENWHTHSLNVYFKIYNSINQEICKFGILNNDSETKQEILCEEQSKQLKYKKIILQQHL